MTTVLQVKEDLLDILKHIKNTTSKNEYLGICGHVEELFNPRIHQARFGAVNAELRRTFKKWPKYSGETAFPIPGNPTPSDAFFAVRYRSGLFNKRNEQGRLRWELLEWMIAHLKKDIANEQL